MKIEKLLSKIDDIINDARDEVTCAVDDLILDLIDEHNDEIENLKSEINELHERIDMLADANLDLEKEIHILEEDIG